MCTVYKYQQFADRTNKTNKTNKNNKINKNPTTDLRTEELDDVDDEIVTTQIWNKAAAAAAQIDTKITSEQRPSQIYNRFGNDVMISQFDYRLWIFFCCFIALQCKYWQSFYFIISH